MIIIQIYLFSSIQSIFIFSVNVKGQQNFAPNSRANNNLSLTYNPRRKKTTALLLSAVFFGERRYAYI